MCNRKQRIQAQNSKLFYLESAFIIWHRLLMSIFLENKNENSAVLNIEASYEHFESLIHPNEYADSHSLLLSRS